MQSLSYAWKNSHFFDSRSYLFMQCINEVIFLLEFFPIEVNVVNLQMFWKLFVKNLIDYIFILIRYDQLTFFIFLSQIDTSNRIWITLKKFTVVSLRCKTLHIHCSLYIDMRLWDKRIWVLTPKHRYWASDQNKRAENWLIVIWFVWAVDNLLRLDKVCHVSLSIYTSARISYTSIVSWTSANQYQGKLFCKKIKVYIKLRWNENSYFFIQ